MKQGSSRESNVPRLRDRLREATTHAILAAAETVVAEQGVESAKMDEIARRAGIAVGTLYNYFADRDALLAAMRDARHAELVALFDEVIARAHDKPFRAQLEDLLRATLGFYENHRQFLTQVMAADQAANRVSGPPKEMLVDLYARVEKIMRGGVKDGVLRASHTEYYPAFLMSMVRAATMVQIHRKQPTPLTDLVGPLVHLFLHGASSEKRS